MGWVARAGILVALFALASCGAATPEPARVAPPPVVDAAADARAIEHAVLVLYAGDDEAARGISGAPLACWGRDRDVSEASALSGLIAMSVVDQAREAAVVHAWSGGTYELERGGTGASVTMRRVRLARGADGWRVTSVAAPRSTCDPFEEPDAPEALAACAEEYGECSEDVPEWDESCDVDYTRCLGLAPYPPQVAQPALPSGASRCADRWCLVYPREEPPSLRAVAGADAASLYGLAEDGAWALRDGTWAPRALPDGVVARQLVTLGDGSVLFLAEGGRVVADGGERELPPVPGGATLLAGAGLDAGDVVVAGTAGVVARWSHGAWTRPPPPTSARLTAIAQLGEALFVGSDTGHTYRLVDGQWSEVSWRPTPVRDLVARDGLLYVLHPNALSIRDAEDERSEESFDDEAYALHVDAGGAIYLATDLGLVRRVEEGEGEPIAFEDRQALDVLGGDGPPFAVVGEGGAAVRDGDAFREAGAGPRRSWRAVDVLADGRALLLDNIAGMLVVDGDGVGAPWARAPFQSFRLQVCGDEVLVGASSGTRRWSGDAWDEVASPGRVGELRCDADGPWALGADSGPPGLLTLRGAAFTRRGAFPLGQSRRERLRGVPIGVAQRDGAWVVERGPEGRVIRSLPHGGWSSWSDGRTLVLVSAEATLTYDGRRWREAAGSRASLQQIVGAGPDALVAWGREDEEAAEIFVASFDGTTWARETLPAPSDSLAMAAGADGSVWAADLAGRVYRRARFATSVADGGSSADPGPASGRLTMSRAAPSARTSPRGS